MGSQACVCVFVFFTRMVSNYEEKTKTVYVWGAQFKKKKKKKINAEIRIAHIENTWHQFAHYKIDIDLWLSLDNSINVLSWSKYLPIRTKSEFWQC